MMYFLQNNNLIKINSKIQFTKFRKYPRIKDSNIAQIGHESDYKNPWSDAYQGESILLDPNYLKVKWNRSDLLKRTSSQMKP